MADDGLKGKRVKAEAAVDNFIEEWTGTLANYIKEENNVEKLGKAVYKLSVIDKLINVNELFVGGVNPEVWSDEEIEDLRVFAVEELSRFDGYVKEIREYIEQETDLEKLRSAIVQLQRMDSYLLGLFVGRRLKWTT